MTWKVKKKYDFWFKNPVQKMHFLKKVLNCFFCAKNGFFCLISIIAKKVLLHFLKHQKMRFCPTKKDFVFGIFTHCVLWSYILAVVVHPSVVVLVLSSLMMHGTSYLKELGYPNFVVVVVVVVNSNGVAFGFKELLVANPLWPETWRKLHNICSKGCLLSFKQLRFFGSFQSFF